MTHSELVLARNILKDLINEHLYIAENSKHWIAEAWAQANTDSLNGSVWFEHLNRMKDTRRNNLRNLKALEALSRHLREETQYRVTMDQIHREMETITDADYEIFRIE